MQGAGDHFEKFVRRRLWAFEGGGIGVGDGLRMQWRIHVPRIHGQYAHARAFEFGVPDATQMMKRRFARAVGAPRGIGVDGSVARNVQYNGATAFAR